jgi:hypothetical protein
MKKKDFSLGGKYLKAEDVKRPTVLTIEIVKPETFGEDGDAETKPVVHFKKARKGLILNLVNWDSIADLAGSDDTDDWPGTQVEVYPTTTEMRGKNVPCLRIRKPGDLASPPPQAKPTTPPASDELDDEIPF